MGYALLFYQALTGINVPNDQAAAVVQALEQSMSSELATKADLAITKSELKSEMAEIRTEMAEIRTEMADIRTEMAELRAELKAEMADIRNDIIALEQRLTLRMGAMMMATSGVLFAALKLT